MRPRPAKVGGLRQGRPAPARAQALRYAQPKLMSTDNLSVRNILKKAIDRVLDDGVAPDTALQNAQREVDQLLGKPPGTTAQALWRHAGPGAPLCCFQIASMARYQQPSRCGIRRSPYWQEDRRYARAAAVASVVMRDGRTRDALKSAAASALAQRAKK